MAEYFPPEDDDFESDEQRPATTEADDPSQRRSMATVVAAGVMLVLLCVVFLFLYDTADSDRSAQRTEHSSAPAESDAPDTPENQVALNDRSAELMRIEEAAIRDSKLQKFKVQRQDLSESLDELAAEMRSWATYSKELLDGDAGRRIASDASYIERIIPILDKEIISQTEYESLLVRFAALTKPLDMAESDADYQPSEHLYNSLAELGSEIDSRLHALRSIRDDADAVQRFAASRSASDETLAEAIKTFHAQRQAKRLADIADAQRIATQEATKLLAEKAVRNEALKHNLDNQRMDREGQQLETEIEEAKRKADEEKRKQIEAAALAQLEREYNRDLPEIRSLLSPFIHESMFQPKRGRLSSADASGPISLSLLQGTGFLNPTSGSREGLYFMISGNRTDPRPLGSFPRYRGGAQDWDNVHPTIKRAQDLLIKYGGLMVEKGLLAP